MQFKEGIGWKACYDERRPENTRLNAVEAVTIIYTRSQRTYSNISKTG